MNSIVKWQNTKYTQSSNQKKKHSQKFTFWARSWFNVAPLRPIKRIARRSLVQGIRRNQNTPLLNYLPKLSTNCTVGDLIKCKPANGHLQAVVNESPPWWEMSTRPPQQKWWGSGLSCFVWAWRNPVTQPSPGPISSACVASHVDRKARWKKWTLWGQCLWTQHKLTFLPGAWPILRSWIKLDTKKRCLCQVCASMGSKGSPPVTMSCTASDGWGWLRTWPPMQNRVWYWTVAIEFTWCICRFLWEYLFHRYVSGSDDVFLHRFRPSSMLSRGHEVKASKLSLSPVSSDGRR